MLLVCRSLKVQNGGMWIAALLPEKFSSYTRPRQSLLQTHRRGRPFLLESLANSVNPVLNDSHWQIKYEQSFGEVVSMSQTIPQQWRRRLVGTGAGTDFLNFLAAGQRGRATTGPAELRASDARCSCPYMDYWLFYELSIRLWQRVCLHSHCKL